MRNVQLEQDPGASGYDREPDEVAAIATEFDNPNIPLCELSLVSIEHQPKITVMPAQVVEDGEPGTKEFVLLSCTAHGMVIRYYLSRSYATVLGEQILFASSMPHEDE